MVSLSDGTEVTFEGKHKRGGNERELRAKMEKGKIGCESTKISLTA